MLLHRTFLPGGSWGEGGMDHQLHQLQFGKMEGGPASLQFDSSIAAGSREVPTKVGPGEKP